MSKRPDGAALAEQARLLSSALAKLDPVVGLVFRGGTAPDVALRRYRAGLLLREDGFVSASRLSGVRGRLKYTIASTRGRDVSPFADPDQQREQEVVFDRGTVFLVLAVDREPVGFTHVILREGAAADQVADRDVLADARARHADDLATFPPPAEGLPGDKETFLIGLRPDGTLNEVHPAH